MQRTWITSFVGDATLMQLTSWTVSESSLASSSHHYIHLGSGSDLSWALVKCPLSLNCISLAGKTSHFKAPFLLVALQDHLQNGILPPSHAGHDGLSRTRIRVPKSLWGSRASRNGCPWVESIQSSPSCEYATTAFCDDASDAHLHSQLADSPPQHHHHFSQLASEQ